ncbi:hypothetical protein C8F01DRAFT_725531 [Mycena amicta]|nr:hypothetical protein C8F01DRAFT_725531 [Mycena amicta]
MEPNIPGMGLLYFSMSGKEEEGAGPTPPPGSKRRRLRGACAECRQRKSACDRAKQPGNICSNCIRFQLPSVRIQESDTAPESTPVQPSSGQDSTDTRPYGGKTAAEHVEAVVVQSTAYIDARDLRTILLEVAQYSRAIEEDLKTCRAQLAASRAGSNAESPSAATSDFSSDVTGCRGSDA